MMKVIITKDSFGIEIWKEGTTLVYEKPFTKVNIFGPNRQNSTNSTMNVDSEKAWLQVGWPFGNKIYNTKNAQKMFPDLSDKLKVGEKIIGELTIVI